MNDGYNTLQRSVGGTLKSILLGGESPLESCANVYEFVKRYHPTIDGIEVTYDGNYRHLRDIAEDDHPAQVLMCGAQTGKSFFLMLNLIRDAIRYWGAMLGYYFPDNFLPRTFSNRRFAPFLRANKELGPWLGRGGQAGKGQDAVYTRTFGPSTILFLSTGGKTSTEGNPLKGLYFDEVRRMLKGDIDRARKRTAAQFGHREWMASTAYESEEDIHHYFMLGDQRWFHTACDCPDGIVLPRSFPDCVEDLAGATTERLAEVAKVYEAAGLPYLDMTVEEMEEYGQAVYVCPRCGKIITDPREGWWEAENPGAWVHSWQMSEMMLPTYSAARVLHEYQNTQDLQEFWNSCIGIPWNDPETQPVTLDQLRACVNNNLLWWGNQNAKWRKKNAVNCAMGVDVQAGYNVVVIKKRAPSGKFRTVHLEIVYGDDPWKETARLMDAYDVRIAVVDGEPHWNEALRFVKAFPGRAWVADEVDGKLGPMVRWGDVKKIKDQKGDVRNKYTVLIHRTKGLRWSLGRWTRRLNEVPPPDALVQRLPCQRGRVMLTSGLRVGRWSPVPICRDLYWPHQLGVAFKKITTTEEAERRGRYRWVAEHVGCDPHFAHANLFADVACARIGSPAHPTRV